jgi:aspartyl-tRNA(Asn)/glutamyl-tRNA(Gln) amidotransferase subunit A
MAQPMTILDAAAALRAGRTTSVALTEGMLERAAALDGRLGSLIVRFEAPALAAAAAADAERAAGRTRGPLHGIPLAIKDNILAREGRATAQSLVPVPGWPEGGGTDATVTARLRAAGAVIVGKTSTLEYAVGMYDAAKPFPIPRNPWDLTKWAGGSSSGSGSGVAAGLFLGALGTDTAGSVRIPAAYCGITGFKPSFGTVPVTGSAPLAFSYDSIGPMARSVADCALMLDVIAGPDGIDPSCVPGAVPAHGAGLERDLKGLRVGVLRPWLLPDCACDPQIAGLFEAAAARLADGGARLVDIDFPLFPALHDTDFIGLACEALAYHHQRLVAHWDRYNPATRLALATGALYSGADQVQAQRIRRLGQQAYERLFDRIDVLILPVSPHAAPDLAWLGTPRAFASRPVAIYTGVFNALGAPALSVPMGFTPAGLPMGLQIAGRRGDDLTVLQAGHAFQRLTDWHLQAPDSIAWPTDVPSIGAPPGGPAEPAAAAEVRALMSAAGLPAAEAEIVALAADYPAVRAAAAGLYRIDHPHDLPPVGLL